MVTITLKSVQINSGKGPKESLELSDTNGGHGHNNLETNVLAGTKIRWLLDKDGSNIKSLVSVHTNMGSTNVFREKPKKVPGAEEFYVYTKKTGIELLGKYDISYIPENSTKVITIDPYIRVKLPQP